MKKLIFISLLLFLSISSTENLYSQSGWNSIFFNNVSTITKIVRRDSINFFAFSGKYYFKSIDAGNNWQSIEEYSFDSTYSFLDGQFFNPQVGWLIGWNSKNNNGAVLKTTNGGINWIKVQTGFQIYGCNCMSFINENTGWIGSISASNGAGCLLKTTNGGINWSKQDFPGNYQIRSVKFFDINNGWVLGNNLVAKTSNGGQNWIQKSINNIPYSFVANTNLCALNTYEAWVLVISGANTLYYSNILRTTNGGDNWYLSYSYTDSSHENSHTFWDVNFVNSSTGFVNGSYNYILRTTNSGTNWSKINVLPLVNFYPVISDLLYINQNEIFVGGVFSGQGSDSPYNYILKSTNLGLNWSFLSYHYHYKFLQIWFSDNNNGLVLADSGRIFKTTDGGNNWNIIYNNKNYLIDKMYFVNNSTGLAIGGYSWIRKTTNSGLNWTEVFNLPDMWMTSINFINQQTGWVTGGTNSILQTTNSGSNWTTVTLPGSNAFRTISISFINPSSYWVLGQYSEMHPWGGIRRRVIWRTTNSGSNWNFIYDSTESNNNGYTSNESIQFLDDNIGFRRVQNICPIMKTTNGGVNWFSLITSNDIGINSMSFLNNNTGWIGGYNYGGIIYKTTNGGLNWFLQFTESSKTVRSVFALNSNVAWFCGDYSSIYSTTNGGGMIIGINDPSNKVVQSFSLSQNYPNPFNPSTTIKFEIPKSSHVQIVVYDLLGREVEQLLNEEKKPGSYEVSWDGSRFASGVYFYKVITDEYIESKKMILMK